tara:strand:+ start:333 stop:590 length:258 start_codon:yes stop_codon:yes gene_type:complete
MFNLGFPEILNINLVSKLNKYNRISGSAVFKWIMKYSGLSFFKIFSKGMKLIKKIQKKEILLKKNPLSGKLKENLNLKRFKKINL